MAVPRNKQELLDAVRINYQKLAAELSSVPPAHARESTLPGHAQGTQMSVADLVAYLIGWGLLVLKWSDAKSHGRPIDFPETGYQWNELGRLAQKFYADQAGQPYLALLTQLADVHARVIALIEQETEASLYGEPWYRTYTLGRMIQFNTASPCANARLRVRKWKKAQHIA